MKHSDAIKDFLPFLINKTIELNLNIDLFPWYLTDSSSQVEFIKQYIEVVMLAMVRYQRNMISDLQKLLKAKTLTELLTDVSFLLINSNRKKL